MIKTYLLTISGMTCEGCVQHVTNYLLATEGVEQVQVDLVTRTARVYHDDEACTPADLMAAVRRAGYQVDAFEMLSVSV